MLNEDEIQEINLRILEQKANDEISLKKIIRDVKRESSKEYFRSKYKEVSLFDPIQPGNKYGLKYEDVLSSTIEEPEEIETIDYSFRFLAWTFLVYRIQKLISKIIINQQQIQQTKYDQKLGNKIDFIVSKVLIARGLKNGTKN